MVIALLLVIQSGVLAVSPECRTFESIYGGGKGLCNNMWGDSFYYEENEANAYTMWFTGSNPNPGVTGNLGLNTSHSDVCHLNYYHKDTPGPESESMRECHPWHENACCKSETVQSPQQINEAYGANWHWDRCGKLSASCERFFVQEACFYECEPEAGLFRRYHPINGLGEKAHNATDDSHNEWEMYKMPIKASYCDSWYLACKHDMFCGKNNGSFYDCASAYEEHDKTVFKITEKEKTEWLIIGIICLVAVVALVCCICVLINKEKGGNPMFMPLNSNANTN